MHDYETFDCSIFQIRLFAAVADEQSFSRAAVKMNIEQPTLSRRISTLEEALGITLFYRDTRPIRLTPEGNLIYEYWKPILSQMDHSIEMLWDYKKKSQGRLAVCIVDSSNLNNEMLDVNREMLKEFPGLSLTLEYALLSRWRSRLLLGEVDVNITTAFEALRLDERFSHETIASFPKLICMLKTNPLCKKEVLDMEDLKDQEFIAIDEAESPEYLEFIRMLCGEKGFEPKIGTRVSNAHGFTSALQKNNQVVICDRLLRGYDNPIFKTYSIPNVTSGMSAVWLRDNRNAFVRPFIDCMREHFKGWTS